MSMKILITGGTGSLGSRLARKWYDQGHELTILSKDPHKMASLKEQLPKARFVITDICDYYEVREACRGQECLIHAAALKQADVGEYFPSEATRVNFLGTQTVARAWLQTHQDWYKYNTALLISSDKAVSALNTYGATKKVAEAVFRSYDFNVLRYGNVVESKGSFLEKWKEMLEKGQPLLLREPEPTRFFLTFDMAIKFIEEVLTLPSNIHIPGKLKAFSIWDVAKEFHGDVVYETLLPYVDKQHEYLLAPGEDWEQASNNLARIVPGNWDGGQCAAFCSETANRMSGQEFLEAVGWR